MNTIILLILYAVIIGGIFFAIKYFIRYQAKVNGKKTQREDELNRMKIDDL